MKSIYAEYLPTLWDEEKVKTFFKRFGEIESVSLSKNRPSSRRKDIAFVNYKSREAALACIKAFSHEQVDEDGSKVCATCPLFCVIIIHLPGVLTLGLCTLNF